MPATQSLPATETQQSAVPLPVVLTRMINGYWLTQSIHVAAKLGIADLLASGPKTLPELAKASKSDERSLGRLLRALASVSIFARENRAYHLTPLAELLRSDVPGSLRGVAIYSGDPEHYAAWGQLSHGVKTGERAFDAVFGERIFDYMAKRPEIAQTFNAAMAGYSAASARAVADHFDCRGYKVIVDVGGGDGRLICELLNQNRAARGIVYEMPHVTERATKYLDSRDMSDRTRVVAGNFFESVPSDGDLYVMKWILHDWDDAKALEILRNVRKAIPAEGRLLIAEAVVPEDNEPFFGKLMDLNMLVMTGGCERTRDEFAKLLSASGFELARVTETGSIVDLVEARPI